MAGRIVVAGKLYFQTIMNYKLFAFDLDGTLLDDEKRLSPANENALLEMASHGAVIAFATGRMGSSMKKYIPAALDDVGLLTMNGAEVYLGKRHGGTRLRYTPLSSIAADYLIDYSRGKPFVCNYYVDGNLYAVGDSRIKQWADLYVAQTGSRYQFVESLGAFRKRRPSKVIFVGDAAVIDKQEAYFRELWADSVYICRTWKHYLEFLDPGANKADGLESLGNAYGIPWPEIVAFGDAANDIPMLRKAGLGIAMANAPDDVKRAAGRVSPWDNNENGVAREWELIKKKESSA
jgi:Cof subfamily protein (haloacid dehalogenase superfamily)